MTGAERAQLPTGRHTISITELIPGVTTAGSGHPTGHDVAGIAAQRGAAMIHGSRTNDSRVKSMARRQLLAETQRPRRGKRTPWKCKRWSSRRRDPAEQAAGGVRVNVLPKEGGNRFTGSAYYSFTNEDLQANNIDKELIALGLTTPNSFQRHHDLNMRAADRSIVTASGSSRPAHGASGTGRRHVQDDRPPRLCLRPKARRGRQRGPTSRHITQKAIAPTAPGSRGRRPSGTSSVSTSPTSPAGLGRKTETRRVARARPRSRDDFVQSGLHPAQ